MLASVQMVHHSDDAVVSFERLLAIQEKSDAPQRDTVRTIVTLGKIHGAQGRRDKTYAMIERALAFLEKSGSAQPDVFNDLRGLLETQNVAIGAARFGDTSEKPDPGRVLELYVHMITIQEKTLGAAHPDLTLTIKAIASFLSFADPDPTNAKLGEGIENLYKQALAFQETILGADHPEVAQTLLELASFYMSRPFQYANMSEPLRQRAAGIKEKNLGPNPKRPEDFDDFWRRVCDLAELYQILKQDDKAESLYKRALDYIDAKEPSWAHDGFDDPYVLKVLDTVADFYSEHGQYMQAEPLYKKAMDLGEKEFGKDGSFVVDTRKKYVKLLRVIQRDTEAQALEVEASSAAATQH